MESDIRDFCQKYNLTTKAFNKIKKIVSEDIRSSIDTRYATAWYMEIDDFVPRKIINSLKLIYPEKYKLIRHGDLLVDTNENEDNMFSVYFFIKQQDGSFTLIELEDNMIPQQFKTIEEFDIDYWYEVQDIKINGEIYNFKSDVLYSYDFEYIPVTSSITNRIKPLTGHILKLIPPDKLEPLYHEYSDEEFYYFRYKNKLYIIPENDTAREGYIRREDNIVIDVVSRWKIIKACVKLLSLQKRAVQRVNHPSLLKQQGVFEIEHASLE